MNLADAVAREMRDAIATELAPLRDQVADLATELSVLRARVDELETAPTLTENDVAELTGASPRTVRAWRVRDVGPVFARIGPRLVRYSRRAVNEYLEHRHGGGR